VFYPWWLTQGSTGKVWMNIWKPGEKMSKYYTDKIETFKNKAYIELDQVRICVEDGFLFEGYLEKLRKVNKHHAYRITKRYFLGNAAFDYEYYFPHFKIWLYDACIKLAGVKQNVL
jgi:hypothetical protein